MKLYIANCTQQNHVVQARVPEINSPVIQDIPIGSQTMFAGPNLNSEQIEAIVAQLRMYGLTTAEDIGGGKLSGKILLIARRDTPVTRDLIMRVYNHNHGVLQKEGVETRQRAAVAMNSTMQQRAELSGLRPQDMMEMSIQEEKAGSIPQDAEVSEGVRVTAQDDNRGEPTRRGRNRKAA